MLNKTKPKRRSFVCGSSKMAANADVPRCSVCLDFFRNPAIIPCGHSFCKDCITGLWDRDVCRCPQCRQTFPDKPAVTDWLQVKELSEKLLKMRTEAEDEDAEAHEVSCDSCSSRRSKAVRSCLTCVSSYCSDHLEKHNELLGWRKHLLTEATDLKSKTCSQHEKLIDVFCRTDHKCVCVLCAVYEHKNHDTVSASEERRNRQRKLMETREKFLQNIQDREKDLNELKQAEESVKCSAQTAVAESERVFSDVVCAVQKTHVSVKELITERQRDELSHIEGLQEKVQQKISRMRMKVSELDQFMTTEDHIHFLQNYPSDCEESTSEEFQDLSSISENPKAFFRNVELLLSKMQERLLDVTKETEIKIKSGEADAPVSLAALFGKKYGQWDCETCLLVNEGTSGYCASCHGPKPNMKSESPSAPAFKFCFGRSGFKEPLESDLNAQIEKIKDKASPADFTFEPSATRKKNSAFSFSIPFPIPTAEFNFGSVSSSGFQLHAEPKKTETERVKSNFDEPIPTSSTFSFTDLLKTSQGSAQEDQKNVFRFGESTTEFNFSFQHVPLKSTSVEASGSDHEEEACKHEDDDTLDFEPVVPLPDLVEISSGEENEQVVFSHRAKLYRYDKELQQWKERGVGELKILQNNESRRARLVMRREQVLKLCANHWITTNMKLEPMKAAEKAWTWSAFDFADGDGSAETLAVRFRLRETADAFKKSFEEAVITSFNGAEREEQSAQERSDADVQIVFERKPTADQAELAAGLMLPHTFFCYRNDPGHASHEDDDDDEDFEGAVRSLKGKLYPDALAGCDAGAATETQNHEEEEKNDDDDEAVNNVELPSVEENEEEILFKQRTKLFLWDRDNNKWKSCGAGDIKILFHPVRKRYRVFMCQEKDKKLCANHCITRTTHPKPLHTNANALTWTAADYSDGDGVIQQFAAKFKTPDLTDSFKKTLTDCQCHVSEFMQPSKSKAVPHAKI